MACIKIFLRPTNLFHPASIATHPAANTQPHGMWAIAVLSSTNLPLPANLLSWPVKKRRYIVLPCCHVAFASPSSTNSPLLAVSLARPAQKRTSVVSPRNYIALPLRRRCVAVVHEVIIASHLTCRTCPEGDICRVASPSRCLAVTSPLICHHPRSHNF